MASLFQPFPDEESHLDEAISSKASKTFGGVH